MLWYQSHYKSETTLPFKAQLDAQNDYIIGSYNTNIAIENGLKFHVDWLKGQKTGFFVDQRENRSLLEKYSNGRNVLNMFCYVGMPILYIRLIALLKLSNLPTRM